MTDHAAHSDPAVTAILRDLETGDRSATERLLPVVYDELKTIAAGYLRRQSGGHTLVPTALVHEAYLKLLDRTRIAVSDRSHFYRLAARVMRQIMVDHARAKGRTKRGGDRERVELDDRDAASGIPLLDVVALDAALHELAQINPRKAQVVDLRVFGGMTIDETADALGISRPTAVTDWRFARAFLQQQLDPGDDA